MKYGSLSRGLLNLWALYILCAIDAHAAISVKDDFGNTVTLQKPARRIISMAPHVTELLFAAGGGDRIVGTVSYSDYPEAAKKLPQIGDNLDVDLERIIAMKPDLVVVWRYTHTDKQDDLLRRLGVPLFYSESHKLIEIPDSVRRLGVLMGTEAVANKAADNLQQKLAALTDKYAHRAPVRLFYQVWDKPLYTLNGQHIVSDAIRVCGGVNIFADMKVTAPNVGIEAVLQEDPEAIIGTDEKNPSDGGVTMWKRYPLMTAVKRNNLFLVDGNLLNRAGPRMIDGTAELCDRLDMARSRRK